MYANVCSGQEKNIWWPGAMTVQNSQPTVYVVKSDTPLSNARFDRPG
jgi:hypothetical protein